MFIQRSVTEQNFWSLITLIGLLDIENIFPNLYLNFHVSRENVIHDTVQRPQFFPETPKMSIAIH